MKLCRQPVQKKRQFKGQKTLLSRQQCRSQTPVNDFIMCTLFAYVDEIN